MFIIRSLSDVIIISPSHYHVNHYHCVSLNVSLNNGDNPSFIELAQPIHVSDLPGDPSLLVVCMARNIATCTPHKASIHTFHTHACVMWDSAQHCTATHKHHVWAHESHTDTRPAAVSARDEEHDYILCLETEHQHSRGYHTTEWHRYIGVLFQCSLNTSSAGVAAGPGKYDYVLCSGA